MEQYGLAPVSATRGEEGGLTKERARRHLWRFVETGESGEVELPAFPGEQVILAIQGEKRSVPWRGPAREGLVLRLAEGFTVAGRVFLPDWSSLNYEGERRLVIAAQQGSLRRSLWVERNVEAGPWGPVPLPILAGARYTVRLEGSPITPVEVDFEAPLAGAQLAFDLQADLGHELWFVAENKEGERLLDAEVLVSWEREGRPNFLRRRARLSDGYINPWSVPPGVFQAMVSAPGYVPWNSGPLAVPGEEPIVYHAVLERGSAIRGRVIHENEPVEDFEVVVWPDGNPFAKREFGFSGRQDGEFELDGLQTGNLLITASSGTLPACEAKAVTVLVDKTVELTLVLPSPLAGIGRVVDGKTQEPIDTSEVQIYVSGHAAPVAPWGTPVRVQADGSFEIWGLAPGQNVVRFRAAGYSDRFVTLSCNSGEKADFGNVALTRPQALEVQLVAPGETVDFSAYGANFGPEIQLPQGRFSADGLVRLQGVDSGRHYLVIQREPSAWRRLTLNLVPNESWRVSHRLAGPRHLTVEVMQEGGEKVDVSGGLFVLYTTPDGVFTVLCDQVPADGIVELSGIDAENLHIEVRDRDLQFVAGTEGSFNGQDDLSLTLLLGGEPFFVHVVDKKGDPIGGVQVVIDDTQPTSMILFGTTDADGVCELRGVPPRDLFIQLSHPMRGARLNVPCNGRDGEVEVVLLDEARLELRLVDGEIPLGEVICRLLTSMDREALAPASSKPDGTVAWEGLSPGHYRISASRSDCWPVVVEAEATAKGEAVAVQMRRLGDILCLVRNQAGLPVAGQAIGLHSLEFEVDVARWVEDGRVEAGAGLVSDQEGRVRVEGLPHGPYRWTLSTSGEPFEGIVTTEPGTVVELPLVLP